MCAGEGEAARGSCCCCPHRGIKPTKQQRKHTLVLATRTNSCCCSCNMIELSICCPFSAGTPPHSPGNPTVSSRTSKRGRYKCRANFCTSPRGLLPLTSLPLCCVFICHTKPLTMSRIRMQMLPEGGRVEGKREYAIRAV